MTSELSIDVKYALQELDIAFIIDQCEDTDYRVLSKHKYVDILMLFSSQFVLHNDGYFPFQLIQLQCDTIKDEIILKSIAKEQPCCHLLSCLTIYSNSVASHVLRFYATLNDDHLAELLDKHHQLEEYTLENTKNSFYLDPIKQLIESNYNIDGLYSLPIVLQSYIFTWHFSRMSKANKSVTHLLNNKLYLDKPCRHYIYKLVTTFDRYKLCRGYFDGKRDDEDEFIFNSILETSTVDQLIIVYKYLLNDFKHKIKRTSYISQMERHLLTHLKITEHYELINLISDRLPLECCSLLLTILEYSFISEECLISLFKMIFNLWDSFTLQLKRDIFTQFVLPLLHMSYKSPLVTLQCLEVTSKMGNCPDFHELIKHIAFGLCKPFPSYTPHFEVINHYYNEEIAAKALICIASLGIEVFNDCVVYTTDSLLQYIQNNYILNQDISAFLSLFVNQEINAIQRTEYNFFNSSSQIIKWDVIEFVWDSELPTFLLMMQYPNPVEVSIDFHFNFHDIDKYCHELLKFAHYSIKCLDLSIITDHLLKIQQQLTKETSLTIKTAITGVVMAIDHNKSIDKCNSRFLRCLVELMSMLPPFPKLSLPTQHYSPHISHLLEIIHSFPCKSLVLPSIKLKDTYTIKEQKHILWQTGLNNAQSNLLPKCNAISLESLVYCVKYLTSTHVPTKSSFYKPNGVLNFVINSNLLSSLISAPILPQLDFYDCDIPIALIKNQAPFNSQLGYFYLTNYNKYKSIPLLLNLFGLLDKTLFDMVSMKGKKASFKPLEPQDCYLMDQLDINWTSVFQLINHHSYFVNEPNQVLCEYLFDKLNQFDTAAIRQFPLDSLSFLFSKCVPKNLKSEYILLFTATQDTIQDKLIHFLLQNDSKYLLVGFKSILSLELLIDSLLFCKHDYNSIHSVLLDYKVKIWELSTNRMIKLCTEYTEAMEIIKNSYFQPNLELQHHFEQVLLATNK